MSDEQPQPPAAFPSPADQERLSRDRTEIREAVTDAWQAWASLENTLAMLLENAVHSRVAQLGLAIYYEPTNAETRFGIVDVAVRRYLRARELEELFLASWKTIVAQLGPARSTRNKIAHGDLVVHVAPNGKSRYRLSGLLFDLERFKLHPDQFPGMSANDIRNHVAKLDNVRTSCQKTVADMILSTHDCFDVPTLRAKSQELAEHLQSSRDR